MKLITKIVATLILTSGTAMASPVYTYVGSWQVDQGPGWWDNPLAYSGKDAAAVIFGGSANDYVISTINNLAADIDFSAWYSVIGVWGGFKFADDYNSNSVLYQDHWTGGFDGSASAYVWDNAQGSQYINYAFLVGGNQQTNPIPEPGMIALFGLGFAGMRFARRKQVKFNFASS